MPLSPEVLHGQEAAPKCCSSCVPFWKETFLFRQPKALVIHKIRHKLIAK